METPVYVSLRQILNIVEVEEPVVRSEMVRSRKLIFEPPISKVTFIFWWKPFRE